MGIEPLTLHMTVNEHDEFVEWSRTHTVRHEWERDFWRARTLYFKVTVVPKTMTDFLYAKLRWG